MTDYKFSFTKLGLAFAQAHSTPEEVVALAQREIDNAIPDGEELDGASAFFIGEQLFIALGQGDGRVMLDTASWEEGPVLESGPFKGKRVVFPRPDSEP